MFERLKVIDASCVALSTLPDFLMAIGFFQSKER